MNDTPSSIYSLEVVAEITGVSTQTLLQYQEHGIIRTELDDETIRKLRRIEHLRETCEMNFSGVKLLSLLLEEVERLREDLRGRR